MDNDNIIYVDFVGIHEMEDELDFTDEIIYEPRKVNRAEKVSQMLSVLSIINAVIIFAMLAVLLFTVGA